MGKRFILGQLIQRMLEEGRVNTISVLIPPFPITYRFLSYQNLCVFAPLREIKSHAKNPK